MIPLIELRGAVPVSTGDGAADSAIIYRLYHCKYASGTNYFIFFARKVLIWGADKPIIGRFFSFCIEKGEKGGKKLQAKAGRGLFVALFTFRRYPTSGNRCMDRNTCGKYP